MRYAKRIRDRCERIGDAPFGGAARPELGEGIRMAVFERSIVILYLVQGERVRITNIFSGGQDDETLLRDHRTAKAPSHSATTRQPFHISIPTPHLRAYTKISNPILALRHTIPRPSLPRRPRHCE
ncbi:MULTISPECIES: type II toxin-antitoxin system RelE/ParE family toxin [Rhizobium]|uniref:type II toxin-antitoxin system RelE/ParE family toxin n=1 Tax=Rhizobium TaxID=379 RepID=UPI0032B2AD2A